MRSRNRSLVALATILCLTRLLSAADTPINFDRDIRPILSEHCFFCHGPDANTREANLRLDIESLAKQHAIVEGDPETSEVMRRVLATDMDQIMPPPESKLPLTTQQKQLLRKWIKQGALYQQHWSFVPPISSTIPRLSDSNQAWQRNPIDAFIASRLEQEGLRPAEEADRESLIRRVTLDLIGLPPTITEIDAFTADTSPNAYEKVVDRLLKSPHYGERMALVWLDAARYADSGGYQNDIKRSQWPWRDWVIRAYNTNMPFDEFTIAQLAGDLLDHANDQQRLATGFNRNHRVNNEGGIIPEEWRVEYVADRVETTSTVWLGLTVGCARCHDHKYDPIPQIDFYRMFAFFNNIDERGRSGELAPQPNMNVYARSSAKLDHQLLKDTVKSLLTKKKKFTQEEKRFNQWFAEQPKPKRENGRALQARKSKARKQFFEEHSTQYATLLSQFEQAESELKTFEEANLTQVSIMKEMPKPRETYLLVRGAYDKPDLERPLNAQTFAALPPMMEGLPTNRLGLAKWLFQDNHPLTARVAVNRYWQMHFGAGLVRTPEDFGSQGERPTHPKLLDWLAVEFRESGWDIKGLQKRIVMSATYRQESRVSPKLLHQDPDNRLLARGPRIRLYAQALRDQVLAASGLLVNRIGGPPVMPHQPAGLWDEVSAKGYKYTLGKGDARYRRSLYTFWRRTVPPPNMMNFDNSTREVCSVRSTRTNTPLQAMNLLNDPQYIDAARGLAKRMVTEGGQSVENRIRHGHRLVLAREPSPKVLKILVQGQTDYHHAFQQDPDAAIELLEKDMKDNSAMLASYVVVANVLFNLDETVTKE